MANYKNFNQSFIVHNGIHYEVRESYLSDHPVENTPLFTIEIYFMLGDFSFAAVENVLSYFDEKGQLKGTRSFDNMTACLTYLVCAIDQLQYDGLRHDQIDRCQEIIDEFKIFPLYTHPRDIAYILYLKEKWYACLFTWILYLSFIVMAKTKEKVRPQWHTRIKKGMFWGTYVSTRAGYFVYYEKFINLFNKNKTYEITHRTKTSTELLYYLRLRLPGRFEFIHWTREKIIPLLVKKFGQYWHKKIFNIYFPDKRHPNRVAINK